MNKENIVKSSLNFVDSERCLSIKVFVKDADKMLSSGLPLKECSSLPTKTGND